jgi:hypothetical protein
MTDELNEDDFEISEENLQAVREAYAQFENVQRLANPFLLRSRRGW